MMQDGAKRRVPLKVSINDCFEESSSMATRLLQNHPK